VQGGKKISCHHPDFEKKLMDLVEPFLRGDPESPLHWVSKSLNHLCEGLALQGIPVGRQTVANKLHEKGFRLQSNKKCLTEGSEHPDRNAQFEHINKQSKKAIKQGNPVISVDAKKKEVLGLFKNGGKEWHSKGNAEKVADHDFPQPELPRALPFGIYDIKNNCGFINVGCDHDTAEFSVNSIREWWDKAGRFGYPHAKEIQIMADGGGSNGYRSRLWKYELQRFANEAGLSISVCHFPPGTSKWNKIEHRLFGPISINWRNVPLIDYETIINYISSTTTATGLKVYCQLDTNKYKTGLKVSDEDMKAIRLRGNKFHKDWNYQIKPQLKNTL
jgi:hypothetical protein